MGAIDDFYLGQPEPAGSCLLTLREIICAQSPEITTAWQYGMPTFLCSGKRFCYLWVQRTTGWPYIGFIDGNRLDHPALIAEQRSRMKILLVDPGADLPVETIVSLLRKAMELLVR